jgi:hypothetical protein
MELKSPDKEFELDRKEVLDKIKKASSEKYETIWDDGGRIVQQKKKSEMVKGKKSKAKGGQFELRVRKDLEDKGWIVDKWSNNFDIDNGKVIPAKRKYNPFAKVMTIGTGFPDFVAFQLRDEGKYKVVGVEVKVNGTLSREEKEKCRWCLKNKIFSAVWVAKKKKVNNRVFVEYINVKEILDRMRK